MQILGQTRHLFTPAYCSLDVPRATLENNKYTVPTVPAGPAISGLPFILQMQTCISICSTSKLEFLDVRVGV